MSDRGVALRDLVAPALAPGGWLAPALQRLDADPFAACVPASGRVALARAARVAGVRMGQAARSRTRWSAERVLREDGVALVEDDGDPGSGPFVHHALYTAPPPRVTLYARMLEIVEALLAEAGLRPALGPLRVREIVLAHELCHHLVHVDGAPSAVRPRVVTFSLGPWRRHVAVRAAEEIAAAGFAAAWCGREWAPAVVDVLTRSAAVSAAHAHHAHALPGGARP